MNRFRVELVFPEFPPGNGSYDVPAVDSLAAAELCRRQWPGVQIGAVSAFVPAKRGR